ncbi:MAG: ATP-binding protein [Marinilabilia sp.]
MKKIKEVVDLFQQKISGRHNQNLDAFFASGAATKLVHALNVSSSSNKGKLPLIALSQQTAQAGRAKYVVIARMTQDSDFIVETIVSANKTIAHNNECFKRDLLHNLANDSVVHSHNAREILQAINISDHRIKHVTAVLLRDHENTPIGAVLGFSKSTKPTKALTNALQFFSFNISSELMHLINQEKLEKKNRELLRTEEELKLKNQLLDNLNKNISKAKQVVDESSRLKSAFLANLSHEIRTPMNVIMGFTELLSAENMSTEQRRNYIDIIQQNGTRLLHIMDSLIDISRFQAKNIGKDQQAFPLNQMMQQLQNTYQPDIEITGKPLKLTHSLGAKDGMDMVVLDKEAIYKVLNHLLDNAVKFTASGIVHFGYEIREQQILFFVEDSGIGLPEGKEKEIFDLFRQGDLRLSRQFGGTGLGLAIAKRYVNAMDGQIWCSNKAKPDRGSMFKFTLPYHPPGVNQSESNKNKGAASIKLLHSAINSLHY